MNSQIVEEFLNTIKTKSRRIVFTKHAEKRAKQRFFTLEIIKTDLLENTPIIATKQHTEKQDEQVFDIYYVQNTGTFHRYVVCLNDEIRIITVVRTTKDIQKKVALK